MSRITKALDKLRQKCTAEGAHPDGTGTADILECIAEHYAGGVGDGIIYFDIESAGEGDYDLLNGKTVQDIVDAFECKPNVYLRCEDEGYIALVTETPSTNSAARFAIYSEGKFGCSSLSATFVTRYQ